MFSRTITLLNQSLSHLSKDMVLKTVIDRYPQPTWRESVDLFEDLIESIVSQQLSVKASDTIFKRVKVLCEAPVLTPKAILTHSDEALRACGLSYAKIKYIKGICEAVLDKSLVLESLAELSDEDVITELIKLKGIGKWSAEMLLMFSLQRPDVFSLGDLGLRKAVATLYGVDRDDLKGIEAISLKWKPYRTVASRYLWLSLDNTPL